LIDLYFWPTGNGFKITIMLEEVALPYRLIPIDLERGDQRSESFLEINPNGRIPAIVDDGPAGGGPPIRVFESAAILLYLAEKTGQLLPADLRGRFDVIQWLTWQVAALGPMAGQAHHFISFAPEKIPYAIERFTSEVIRLCAVLESRLVDREYLAGEYSIADIASWPWIEGIMAMRPDLMAKFPAIARWHRAIGGRPGVQRGRARRIP